MDISELEFDQNLLTEAISAVDLLAAEKQTCEDYSLLFGRKSESSTELSDPLKFLAIVCGWRLRPDDQHSPFECLWHPSTWENVSESQLATVAAVTPAVKDVELHARLSDLLWIRKRCHINGRAAAEAYLSSAELLIQKQQRLGERERLRRALQLAAQLGRAQECFSQAIRRITHIVSNAESPHSTVANAMDLLLEFRDADATHLCDIARNRAASIRDDDSNPLWERRFWEIAAKFAGQNGDIPSQRAALTEVARTFECEAENAPIQAVAAHFWEMALHAYRKVPGTEDARSRVHQRLLASQKGMRDEMVSIKTEPLDLTDIVATAKERLHGKDLPGALAELVFATRWQEKLDVRRQVEKNIKSFPLQHMFSSSQLSSTGKVAATAPSGVPLSGEFDECRIHAEMCRHYKYFIPIVTNGTIEPMRHEILLAHNVTLQDIATFLQHSPYIPYGRETFFIIGIHAGMHGRFIESLHVLIPQVEHMLRALFAVNDVITSSVNAAGVQQEYDLNRMLSMREAESLLGESLCFVMRVLFTERYGYNLRNELSHGMLSPGSFYSDAAVYSWWLILRIVAGPVAETIIADASISTSAQQRTEGPHDPS